MVTEGKTSNKMNTLAVVDWLIGLYGRTKGYVSIVSTSNWAGRAFEASSVDDMVKYVIELDNAGVKGIYARVTTLRRPPEEGQRGSDDDSFYLPGLWADMDLAGPGHKTTKRLPETFEDCQAILAEAKLATPTLWIHSGGGLYPWWLFGEPVEIDGPEDIAFYQELSRGWHDAIAGAAERLGFHYGPVPDLARVLRIPGTLNRKVDGDPRPCTVLMDTVTAALPLERVLAVAGEAADHLASHRPQRPLPQTVEFPRIETGNRPGDELARKLSWAQILEPAGFVLSHARGVEEYWVRPGKHPRDGHSVTTNYGGSDLMWVFSTEVEGFDANTSYSKFAAWSILNGHGMDFRAAALALSGRASGPTESQVDIIRGIVGDYTPPPPPPPAEPAQGPVKPKRPYDLTDTGNGHRMRDLFGHKFRWVEDYKGWMRYDGVSWSRDSSHAVTQAAEACTELMWDQLDDMERDLDDSDEEAKKKVEAFRKHIKSSRSDRGIKAAVSRFAAQRGVAVQPTDFDQAGHLITVDNGVLNLRTRDFDAHDPHYMLTRRFNASYDPDAQCPKWMRFLEQVLPDPEVRAYVQRAMGYTLLGEADRRVMFLLYGPSGTGKSQFTEALAHVFGNFGQTAAASTFRKKHGNASATNDLHGLKGKRLITSSETSEASELDEELLKRFTGRDQITSRDLYEKFQSWVPEGVVWLTTNFLPKLSSDDNAVWMRVKPIEFAQIFAGTVKDEPNVGVQIAREESAGILNWLLDGVAAYRTLGLQEPEKVTQSSADHRRESDNVAQFLEEALDDGLLIRETGANDLKVAVVFDRYEHWCKQNRIPPLGIRRFNQRLTSHGLQKERRGGYYYWMGLRLNPVYGIAGTMT